MRKKLVSVMLCLALAVSACACGSTQETQKSTDASESEKVESSVTTSESASQESEVVEEEESLYPVVDTPIKVTGLTAGKDMTNSDRIVWNKVSEITGIEFEWINVDGETLATYLAGGEWPDFIHINLDSTLVNDYGVEGGMFADYTEYLDVMPNLSKVFEEFPSAKKLVKETNGAIYRLPSIEISATATQARAYYRTDLLEEAGLSMPRTTEELYNALKVLKEKNGEPAFCPRGLSETGYWGLVLYSAFGPSVNADFEDDGNGNVVYMRTSDQYKHYLEYLHKLYEEELMNQEYLTLDKQAVLALAQEGTTAFLGDEAHSLKDTDFKDGQFHLSACIPFTSEYDSEIKVLGQLDAGLSNFFINADSEYVEELCKAFDIMFASEEVVEGSGLYGASFCYGLENVHWKYNNDGSNTYEFILPEGYNGSFTDFQYKDLIIENAGLCTAFAGYITSTPGNGQVRQKAFVENVMPYHCEDEEIFPTKFLKFTSDEQYVITQKYTDIQSYMNEMKSKFISGVADIEKDWDEYCNTLETMGIKDVLKVYQAAYDRWNQ